MTLPTCLQRKLVLAGAALAVVFAGLSTAQGPPAKMPLAHVTVSGKDAGTVTTDDGKKKDRYVEIEVDPRTTVRVGTSQDAAKFAEQVLAQHEKLTKAFTAQAKKLAEKNDLEALKKAEKEFMTASDEILKNLGNLTAEGTLTVADDHLRLEGKLRVFDFKGADKDLGKGKARVEGMATQVPYDAGQGEKNTLAIKNGDKAIIVTGKAAEGKLDARGTIRVVGALRVGSNGHAVIEAEAIEVLKK